MARTPSHSHLNATIDAGKRRTDGKTGEEGRKKRLLKRGNSATTEHQTLLWDREMVAVLDNFASWTAMEL